MWCKFTFILNKNNHYLEVEPKSNDEIGHFL